MMDKIIDCHMHFSAKGIFNKTAENIGLKCTLEEVQNEFKKNNILAHSLNIFTFSHKKEERPYFFNVPLQ